jgi:5-methylcytosine-specific restriction protein B
MNTADRSVEALDAALRRRFSFVEMQPDSTKIKTIDKLVNKGIDLSELLTTINERIEKLLDKDHQIGHSYFINIEDLEGLKLAFKNKIIPLLQEYFFGDYGKIGLILGEDFFEKGKPSTARKETFAKFSYSDVSDFSERVIYRFKNITSITDEDFVVAINSLLNKNTDGE